jgi:hypothetical protein
LTNGAVAICLLPYGESFDFPAKVAFKVTCKAKRAFMAKKILLPPDARLTRFAVIIDKL